jgi:hypothetical protein
MECQDIFMLLEKIGIIQNRTKMPRYNLNHQDIHTIVNGLDYLAINAHSTQEHTRITNLKNRLLSRLSSSPSSEDDDLNPWEVFHQPPPPPLSKDNK